jgi:Mg2+ and Co2+ transporter CorA
MASARTTYPDTQGGEGRAATAHPFVWVSLRDPSPEELAAVQREFGLPAPLMDGLATAAPRPVLELTGELLFAVVKTTTWVAAEEAVFSPARARPTERIYQLSRQLLEFRRAVAPLTEMLDRLAAGSTTAAGERLKQRYRERRAHLLHLVELADGLGNLLSNVLQANLTEVSVRQNDDMRRISAWVAIWAIPTLLAGIYGMNFRHLPELECAFGYPLVLVVMALICLGLYRAFRHSGWL